MSTSFELMDLDSGNLVGSYKTLEEALEVIRNAYSAYGRSGIDDLGLVRVEGSGSQQCIASGAELIDYVLGNPVELQDNESMVTARNDGNQGSSRSRVQSTRAS
jgi:hypothetical protein